ncbi:MAG: DUF1559 domain-containing protein [Pirellulaceae bacterium]|nr:DUF1559 domain-containing protein [Pirellulaceae bacterium]
MTALRILLAGVLMTSVFTVSSFAQTAFVSTEAEHVPLNAIMSSRMNVPAFLNTPSLDWLPVEVAQAWSKEQLGLDPMSIIEIKSVTGMPTGPGEPPMGFLVTLSADYDPADISPALFGQPATRTIAGKTVHVVGQGQPAMLVHALSPRKILVATEMMFEPMLNSAKGGGPVANLIRENPMENKGSQMVLAIEPLRPMLQQMMQQAANDLPPELGHVTKLPDLLDALIIESASEGIAHTIDMEFLCKDADAAAQVHEILDDSIKFARLMAINAISQNIRGEGRMPDAQRAYVTRIANHIVGMIRPEQQNDRVLISIRAELPIATTGVLVGLLLPALQAAREAARRMNASNNLKQIGLAFHNHHSAFRRLPSTITDDDGKPLLSWRVAILPFIEQQALYEQFHLDEPWDSDHNIQFADAVISVFEDPSLPLPPGKTVFRALIGEHLGLKPEGQTSFRDITDGTSNTIAVVEADASEAVVWSKPDVMEINMDDPISQMGHIHAGGFHALFYDGSVRFITHSIDVDLFKALLTRDGGERVPNF